MSTPIFKEDTLLPVEMEKLEIEPVKTNFTGNDENPFNLTTYRSSLFSRAFTKNKCNCFPHRKADITIPIYKKKTNKIIKEPILKLLQNCTENNALPVARLRKKCLQTNQRNSVLCIPAQQENLTLCSLVDNCNQLTISSNPNEHVSQCSDLNGESKWWAKSCKESAVQSRESNERNWAGPSCSQEALNPPCDVTIDELASYFETLVHIPKKMSSMAEMMYI